MYRKVYTYLKERKEMYPSSANDPDITDNNQMASPSHQSRPGQFQPSSPQNHSHRLSAHQGAFPPLPPNPGQFYSSPPPPPNPPFNPYDRKTLFILTGTYIAFWLFVFIAGAASPNGFAIFLGNFGISLFWGTLISILIMDWHGFFTINGWVQRKQGKRANRILLAFLCLIVSPFLLGVYLARIFLMKRRLAQQISTGPGHVPLTSRRPRLGIIIGTIVTLFTLFFYTVLNTSGTGLGSTSTVSPAASSTTTAIGAINPTPEATQMIVTPTAIPTKVPTPIPTRVPTPVPTSPPAPQPTQAPPTGVNGNPWGYDFVSGNLIYNPPSNFCAYFNCIASFWKSTNGYVDECNDTTYSHSGGVSGACSRHGGEMRPLYSH